MAFNERFSTSARNAPLATLNEARGARGVSPVSPGTAAARAPSSTSVPTPAAVIRGSVAGCGCAPRTLAPTPTCGCTTPPPRLVGGIGAVSTPIQVPEGGAETPIAPAPAYGGLASVVQQTPPNGRAHPGAGLPRTSRAGLSVPVQLPAVGAAPRAAAAPNYGGLASVIEPGGAVRPSAASASASYPLRSAHGLPQARPLPTGISRLGRGMQPVAPPSVYPLRSPNGLPRARPVPTGVSRLGRVIQPVTAPSVPLATSRLAQSSTMSAVLNHGLGPTRAAVTSPFGTPIGVGDETRRRPGPGLAPLRGKTMRAPRPPGIGPSNTWVNRTLSQAGIPANELAVTTVPSDKGPPILFATYNTNGPKTVSSGWSRSKNGGATWSSWRDATTPLPRLPITDPSFAGYSHEASVGDTWTTAVGPDMVVAMVSVISVPNWPIRTDVGLWVSTDGGLTFPPEGALRVSEAGSNGVDGPKMVADPSGEAIWVWWFSVTTEGRSKTWLRKIDIRGGIPVAASEPLDLSDTSPGIPAAIAALLGVAPAPPGPGLPAMLHASMAIAPREAGRPQPRLFLVYASDGMSLPRDTKDRSCANPANRLVSPVTWSLAYSDDSGISWRTEELTTDSQWPRCTSFGALDLNRSFASTAYDPISRKLLIALNRSVFRADGLYIGTRAVLYQWPSSNGSGRGFDSWVPVCNPAACPEGVACVRAGTLLPNNETFCHQYGPSVGTVETTDESGRRTSRAAWMWYDTRDAVLQTPYTGTTTDIWGASVRPGAAPADERTVERLTPFSSSGVRVPWNTDGAAFGNAWFGDYSNGVTPFEGRFYGMWTDMRDDGNVQRIYGTSFAR